ncbi:hypothetical protein O9993_11060 [Vibrio lentus]|nr:hypothetical protein [Vibrio lentus]
MAAEMANQTAAKRGNGQGGKPASNGRRIANAQHSVNMATSYLIIIKIQSAAI